MRATLKPPENVTIIGVVERPSRTGVDSARRKTTRRTAIAPHEAPGPRARPATTVRTPTATPAAATRVTKAWREDTRRMAILLTDPFEGCRQATRGACGRSGSPKQLSPDPANAPTTYRHRPAGHPCHAEGP